MLEDEEFEVVGKDDVEKEDKEMEMELVMERAKGEKRGEAGGWERGRA